jgi:hypothetical protein
VLSVTLTLQPWQRVSVRTGSSAAPATTIMGASIGVFSCITWLLLSFFFFTDKTVQ